PNGNGNGNGNGDDEDGVVNVIFSTPGNGRSLYATPHRAPAGTPDDYEENPATSAGEFGLWVIGEEQMDTQAPGSGSWAHATGYIPTVWRTFFHTSGGVVRVSPAEDEGGVLHAGNHF